MGVKRRVVTRHNRFPAEVAAARALHGRKIQVGVLGERAWLAGIHEYGCRILVTPKMRAYLHSQGLHLKADTTELVIPERAFLRTGFDQGKEPAEHTADQLLGRVLGGELEGGAMLEAVGRLLAKAVQDYAQSISAPPNHPFTAGRKQSADPLKDTGALIAQITYEVN